MSASANPLEVYLEIRESKAFAVSLHWPGWCRVGRDESVALQSLLDYAPRYASVLKSTSLGFRAPSGLSDLIIVERVTGTTTTNFGAPDVTLTRDSDPLSPADLQRIQEILQACWAAFDTVVHASTGKTLRKGARGGGRDLSKVVQHVRDVNVAYLTSLGGKLPPGDADYSTENFARVRQTILTTLAASARGEIPARGPRGGLRWLPRYFARRLAWHDLDHAWEIEDRAEG